MSEDVKGTSGAPSDAASGDQGNSESSTNAASGGSQNQSQETVARNTYLKTLGEAKSAKQKLAEVQARLDEMEEAQLSANGNKDQLIESLKSKLHRIEAERAELAGNFVERSLKDQFKSEALKQGIKKPEIMDRLVNYQDFVESVDTKTFQADETDVKATVEQVKSEFPELFSRESPKINNRTTSVDADEPPKKSIDFKKLSREEANKLAEEIDRMEGKRANFING